MSVDLFTRIISEMSKKIAFNTIAYPFSENGICDSAKTDITFGGMAYAIFRQCADFK